MAENDYPRALEILKGLGVELAGWQQDAFEAAMRNQRFQPIAPRRMGYDFARELNSQFISEQVTTRYGFQKELPKPAWTPKPLTEGTIRLEVRLPSCRSEKPREPQDYYGYGYPHALNSDDFYLITKRSGGHDVGIGYERYWALHQRANVSYPAECPNDEYYETVEGGSWVCPECGAVKE